MLGTNPSVKTNLTICEVHIQNLRPWIPESKPPFTLFLKRRRTANEAENTVFCFTVRKKTAIYCGTRNYAAKVVGYIINKEYQRQGFAGEALSAVIHNAFREGVHRVYAECDPRNTASWKLLESLGFRREAHFRQNFYFWKDADGSPIWKDTYVYAILESDESIRKDSKL